MYLEENIKGLMKGLVKGRAEAIEFRNKNTGDIRSYWAGRLDEIDSVIRVLESIGISKDQEDQEGQ